MQTTVAIAEYNHQQQPQSNVFKCSICSITCVGLQNYKQHLVSWEHKLKEDPAIDKRLPEVNDGQTFYCDVCEVPCSGHACYQQHLLGIKHKRNEQRKKSVESDGQAAEFVCKVCDISCCGATNYSQHLAGAKHKSNVFAVEGSVDDQPVDFLCEICNISCCGALNFNQHLAGTKHKSNVATTSEEDTNMTSNTLFCKICEIVCAGQETLDAHLTGTKHKNKVASIEGKQDLKTNEFFCKFCEVSCTGPDTYNSHLSGSKHKQNLAVQEGSANCEPTSGRFYCESCDVSCSSNLSFTHHLTSTKHKRKISPNTSMDTVESDFFRCEVCNKKCNSLQNLTSHLNSLKHRLKVPKYQNELFCVSCNMQLNSDNQYSSHIIGKSHLRKSSSITPPKCDGYRVRSSSFFSDAIAQLPNILQFNSVDDLHVDGPCLVYSKQSPEQLNNTVQRLELQLARDFRRLRRNKTRKINISALTKKRVNILSIGLELHRFERGGSVGRLKKLRLHLCKHALCASIRAALNYKFHLKRAIVKLRRILN